MTDHDPPIKPLRPLDPTTPDPQGEIGRLEPLEHDAIGRLEPIDHDAIGRLEPIDPAADDSPRRGAVAPTASVTKAGASRTRAPRDGLVSAVALTALLSLSSIAAIGGLVAISMRTVSPTGSTAVAPVESSAQLPTIHVGESAQGPESQGSPDRRSNPAPSQATEAAPVQTVATAVIPAGGGFDDGARDKGERDRKVRGGKWGTEGAWCDAEPGSACDATVGGAQALYATDGPADAATP